MILRPYQDALVNHTTRALWNEGKRRLVWCLPVGAGKAQPLDAKVLTPTGWTLMGRLRVGDEVIAGDGSVTVVTGVFPQGERPVFRVTFSDGASTECCDEHLWVVRDSDRRCKPHLFLSKWVVRPLAKIATNYRTSRGDVNYDIPLVRAEFTETDILVDPYLLGLLLGDGGLKSTSLGFSTVDGFILGELRRLVPAPCVVKHLGRCDYSITSPESRNILKTQLREYGLLGAGSEKKHIPDQYLLNTTRNRIALLQGLMDTDGTVSNKSSLSYCTTSPELATGVVSLVRSLGGVATISWRTKTFTYNGVKKVGRPAANISISLPSDIAPFRLPRKAVLVREKTKYPPRRYLSNIQSVGVKATQCISVRHSSKTYVTDDFIVTHNTPCAVALITRMRAADWAAVYFLAHTAELVTQPGDRLRGLVDFGFMKAGLLGDAVAPVQVGSVQTAVRRPLPPLPRLDGSPHRRCVVFVDEGHRCRSSTYRTILDRLGESYEFVYMVIMTATPYRRDGRGLADVADALVEAVTPREMFAAGWLVEPVTYSRPPTAPGTVDSVAADSAAQSSIVGDVVAEWSARDEGKPWVARCVNRAHARDVADRLRASGARTAHVDGKMSEPARELLLARLAIGGRASDHPLALDVLCSGGTILEEGFDSASSYRHVLSRPWLWSTRAAGDPPPPGSEGPGGLAPPSVDDAAPRYRPLYGLVDAAPTSSRGSWIQRVGRVDRPFTAADVAEWAARGVPADEKRSATVLCHSGNLERHGFLVQHEGFQLTGDRTGAAPERAYPRYRPPSVATCTGCFASVARGEDCAACGEPCPPSAPSLPDERKSVRLERADPSAAPPVVTDEEREAFLRGCWASWSRARASALAAGRKPPSAWQPAAIYKKRFGSWPDRGLDSALGRQFGAKR